MLLYSFTPGTESFQEPSTGAEDANNTEELPSPARGLVIWKPLNDDGVFKILWTLETIGISHNHAIT